MFITVFVAGTIEEYTFAFATILAGTLIGFRKESKVNDILKEALSIALVEKYIRAEKSTHRHDQAIISLLMYKHYHHVLIFDKLVNFFF